MKRIRICAMLLSAALTVSSIPCVGVSASQVPVSSGYAAQEYQTNNSAPVSEATTTKKATKKTTVKLGWVKKNNKWYYVTKKGNQKGWAKIDGHTYYFDANGVMKTGWAEIKGRKYYFAKSGEMKTGWQKLAKKWYYFEQKGWMRRGWRKLGSTWYYMNDDGVMQTGWQKIKGKTYYFAKDGGMFNGPHVYKIGKKYYFFEKEGNLTTTKGWKVSDQGNHFYTYTNGTVAVNTKIGGKKIGADGVGVLITNNEMDAKAQGYSSRTNYMVLANLSTHKLCIYKGNKGEWKRFKGEWDLTCGAPGTRTPCGQFELCYKHPTDYGWKWFTLSRAAYVYWTTAGFMLHTILYSKWGGDDPEYVDVVDDRLGMNLSLSCIRLSLEDARFIYDNIPVGTRLVVYEE